MSKHIIGMNQDGIGFQVQGESEDDTCAIDYKSTGDGAIKVSNTYGISADNSITFVVDTVSITITTDQVLVKKDSNTITLDGTAIQLKAGSSSITLQDGSIDLAADSISVKGNQSISIESSDSLNAQGASVGIKGTQAVSVESSMALDLKASTTATLKGTSTSVG